MNASVSHTAKGVRRPRQLAGLLALMIATLPGIGPAARAATAEHGAVATVTAAQAVEQLRAGNARFVAHQATHPRQDAARVRALGSGQRPIAIVLSCSDSRVPPEVVFDQGLGDLFVIRVAGNIANDAVIGSIEYAVEHLGAPLVVVMGHQRCGAVSAAMAGGESGNHIHALVDAIMPVVAEAKKSTSDPLDAAVRLNVQKVVGELERSQPMLAEAAAHSKIRIVGAYYALDTGAVSLLAGKDPAGARAAGH